MNGAKYFDQCEELLTWLSTRIEIRGSLNVLNLNIHCEDFYAHLINLLIGLQLKNLNAHYQNVEGIDLIDELNKVIVQISATATKAKVTASLAKDLSAYKGYEFKFVSISKDAAALRLHTYANPHGLTFDPKTDIYDVRALIKIILHMEIEEKEKAYVFLKKQLQFAQPSSLVETNLALIVKIISSENLADLTSASSSPFNVDEKIAFNSLSAASVVIEDYKIHHHRVERIYGDFDTAGKNKSKSVLDAFRNVYLKLSVNFSGDDLYFHVVEEIIKIVHASSNHVDIPFDELELLVNVLAVDAFIRCKIFKAPGIFNAST